MDTAKYAALFLSESRDNLVAINEALLELERDAFAAPSIDSLFRAVHTMKGMAGVMGYGAVVDLAHDLETLLSGARDGTRPLAPDDIELLFDAADALEAAIEHSANGGNAPDVSPICQRLRIAAGSETPEAAAHTATAEFRVPLLPGSGVAVHVRLAGDTPLKGARAMLILQRARTLGRVSSVAPEESRLQDDAFGTDFSFRVVTDASDERIAKFVRDAGYVDSVALRRTGDITPPHGAIDRTDVAWSTGALKAPLQRFVRIDVARLDALMNQVGELVIARGRLLQAAAQHADADLDDALGAVSRLVSDLQAGILAGRMVPVWQVFDRFPRVVRDAARTVGKEVEFTLHGREIELDRALLEQIGDPLIHLLRNAVDHGLEPPDVRVAQGKPRVGRVSLTAMRDRSAVVIRVTDDGRGIDRAALLDRARRDGLVDTERTELSDDDVLRLIARPGFSTAERVTSLSGRGVGVDAVVSRVRSLGGSVDLRSDLGVGTTISLRLPVTLAIMPALLARVAAETYVLPLTHVRETLNLTRDGRRQVRGRDVLILRDEILPLRNLSELVSLPPRGRDAEGSQVVVLEMADRRTGLVVDQLLGQQDVVVKPFDAVRGAAACFSGATILSDGTPALILEASSFV